MLLLSQVTGIPILYWAFFFITIIIIIILKIVLHDKTTWLGLGKDYGLG